MIGIYKIECLKTGEVYIGQSTTIFDRWDTHISKILNKTGINRFNKELEITDFTFQVVELCKKEQLDEREIYWIKYYNSFCEGLNRTTGGSKKYLLKMPDGEIISPKEKIKKIKIKVIPELPREMLNKWLTVSQCREYVAAMEIKDSNSGKMMTWNAMKSLLPTLGYVIEKKRKTLKGKTQECYFISKEKEVTI